MPNTCPGAGSGVLGVPRARGAGRKGRQTPGLASHVWPVKPYIGINEHYIGGGSRIALLYGIPIEKGGGCRNLLLRLSSAGREEESSHVTFACQDSCPDSNTVANVLHLQVYIPSA